MLGVLSVWLFSALVLYLTAQIVPGFEFESFTVAIWSALFLGFFNSLIRPILMVLTLPINILTLGLFTFVVNALMLSMVAYLVSGFHLSGFLPAVFAAILISILSSMAQLVFGRRRLN